MRGTNYCQGNNTRVLRRRRCKIGAEILFVLPEILFVFPQLHKLRVQPGFRASARCTHHLKCGAHASAQAGTRNPPHCVLRAALSKVPKMASTAFQELNCEMFFHAREQIAHTHQKSKAKGQVCDPVRYKKAEEHGPKGRNLRLVSKSIK